MPRLYILPPSAPSVMFVCVYECVCVCGRESKSLKQKETDDVKYAGFGSQFNGLAGGKY